MAMARIPDEELESSIAALCDQLSNLRQREIEVENSTAAEEQIEKASILRRIRVEKRDITRQLADLSVQKALRENNVGEEQSDETDEGDDNELLDFVPAIAEAAGDEAEVEGDEDDEAGEPGDVQQLDPQDTNKYNRLLNLCRRTRADIKDRKTKIADLIKAEGSQYMTDSEKRHKEVKIRSSIKTIQEQVRLYKEYNKDLTKICSSENIEALHKDLTDVLDAANEIECLFESSKELEKRIERSSDSASIRNLSIDKYSPTGLDRFIKFNTFMTEFEEYVLQKPLKDLLKLNLLKSSVLGEARELISKYTLGSQLKEALNTLQNQYSKPEFVLAEIYRSLKTLPTVNNFQGPTNINKAKEQISVLKIAICTLKGMGFESELLHDASLQNSFLLVDVEGRIPIQNYLNWSEEKDVSKLLVDLLTLKILQTFMKRP